MPRGVYFPPTEEGAPVLEIVSRHGKATPYLYRFMGEDGGLVTVHKNPSDHTPVGLLSSLAYTVRRIETGAPYCNCPWMQHHPDDPCKHGKLVRACWAHFIPLRQHALALGGAALELSDLYRWSPGDPPIEIGAA